VTQKIHPLTGWKKENIPGMDEIRRFKKNTRKTKKMFDMMGRNY